MKRTSFWNMLFGIAVLYVIYAVNKVAANSQYLICINIAIGLAIVWAIYKDIIVKKISTAGYWLANMCNTDKGKDFLEKYRKYAFFKKGKKLAFICDCYYALDKNDEALFENFIDKNAKNRLLSDKGCSLTFEYTLLLYFFFKGRFENFKSAYNRIQTLSEKRHSVVLDPTTSDMLNICNEIACGKTKEAEELCKSFEVKKLSKRNKCYFYLSQIVMYKHLGSNSSVKHYKELITKEEINLPFILDFIQK